MYNICIFDMDGTILNTLDSIAFFGNSALESLGLEVIPKERYKRMVGNGADMLMRRMLIYGGNDISLCGRLREEYDKCYEAEPLKLTRPYPGIGNAMESLKESGVKLGILSNKPDNVTREIAQRIFPNLFDRVQGQLEGVPIKPDPAALLQMTKDLGGKKKDVFYCGDSEVDMQTGKRAGVFTAGVSWGFREVSELLENGADCILETAEELYGQITGKDYKL